MNGKIKVRNGFFSKTCEFSYNSGYLTQVDCIHEQRASYDKSIRNVRFRHHYLTKVKMNDFDTREELKIEFPFKTDLSHNDMATIFYVEDYNKNYETPIGFYNHEADEGYIDYDQMIYIGFRLLNVGRFKRGVASVVNVVEHLIAFAIIYGISFSLLQGEITALFIGLLFTKLVWFPVGFISNLFFPSYFGARRAYVKFDEELVRIGKEEMNKSRKIKAQLAAINDPLRVLRDNGIEFGDNQLSQQNTLSNNGGFKPMF